MRLTAKTFPALVTVLLLVAILAATQARTTFRIAGDLANYVTTLNLSEGSDQAVLLPAAGQPGIPMFAGRSATGRLGIQFKDGDNARFDLAEGAGFGVIRKGLYWSRVEQEKGQYDFAWFDEIVNQAEARGMIVSATLFGNNPLYGDNEADGAAVLTDDGRRGFAKFAAAAAARYAGQPVVFEIWNEPNLRQFWRAHPANPDASNIDEMADEYVLLVKAVAPAMKAANPDAFISAGSISALWRESFSWFDRAIEKGLLDSGIDAISVHPYGFEWPELAAPRGYSVIRSKLADAGQSNLKLVNTEVGFDASDWITDRGYSQEEAMRLQGALMIRQQLLDLLSGLEYSIWYEFRSSDTYGLLDNSFAARPAYLAAKTMYAELDGHRLLGRAKTPNSEDFLLQFTNGTDEKWVAWTSPPLFRAKAVAHEIPIDFEPVKIVDSFGQDMQVSGGTLELNEYPKFVTLKPVAGAAGKRGAAAHD